VVDGAIQCPYHGWRYNGAGECTAMPSTAHCGGVRVDALPAAEADGLVWVWPGGGPAPAAPPPVTRPPPGFQARRAPGCRRPPGAGGALLPLARRQPAGLVTCHHARAHRLCSLRLKVSVKRKLGCVSFQVARAQKMARSAQSQCGPEAGARAARSVCSGCATPRTTSHSAPRRADRRAARRHAGRSVRRAD